jgi:hypothetical protein
MKNGHLLDHFYIVAVISNPVRFKSRYALFLDFEKRMEATGSKLIVVEIAHGDRSFEVTSKENPNHIQLRSDQEVWQKEAMINVAVAKIISMDPKVEGIAWIDADISFVRPDWALETMHALQHYDVVQMFDSAIDLGPKGEALHTHKSFGWVYLHEGRVSPKWNKEYTFPHPGFAWAATRKFFDTVCGLMDFAICGSADHHMVYALLDRVEETVPVGVHPNYLKNLKIWQDRAKNLQRNIGYVPGTILHHWHGPKTARGYQTRWDIITKNQFDPDRDIAKDFQGLIKLTGTKPQLRDDLRRYFRSRNEDSIEVY